MVFFDRHTHGAFGISLNEILIIWPFEKNGLFFFLCSKTFMHVSILSLIKFWFDRPWFFQVLLHQKDNFSLKARLLGFHWALFRMPHGYAYQKIPFPYQSYFMGVTPLQLQGRTVLWRALKNKLLFFDAFCTVES